MAETASARLEPTVAGPTVSPATAAAELKSAVESTPSPAVPVEAPGARPALDQLSRIEDKAARIEEKFARSEALVQRVGDVVEAATNRIQDAASHAEVAALRGEVNAMAAQVRRLPGKTALVSVAIVTALLTAAIVLAVIKFVGLPR
jgi:hypothetical protein